MSNKKWSAEKVRQVQSWLADTWPEFFTPGADLKPLALDIHQEILKHREENPFLSRRLLDEALKRHTQSYGYLYGLCKNTHRFDLQGAPVSPLSPESRITARTMLKRLQKQAARNKRRKKVSGNVGKRPVIVGGRSDRSAAAPIRNRKAPVVVYRKPRRRIERPLEEVSLAS